MMPAMRLSWLIGLCLLGCGSRSELYAFGEPGPADPGCPGCDDDCGNGVVEAEEECDLGGDNEDRPALLLTQGSLWKPVMPVDRAKDPVSFYGYVSESSHTGFERVDLSALYAYRDTATERLYLVTHHGIDYRSSGVLLDEGYVELEIEGLPPGAAVVLADEGHELALVGAGRAEARWEFWRNTDGGVLGQLPFPGNWSIEHRIHLQLGIVAWAYVEAAGTEVPLETGDVAVLTAFATPSECRTDCTIPACGDAFVDGGEVCDDGNREPGDGCEPDCKSLH
jgi:cysteine-rich repeat protein